jgi:transposase
VNTFPANPSAGRRRRRRHSDEFKAEVVAACMQPGISIAAVALTHGINANLLRRWVKDAEMAPAGAVATNPVAAPPALARPAFVSVTLPKAAPAPDILIELRHGAVAITVTWPVGAAADCAAWMRELLR